MRGPKSVRIVDLREMHAVGSGGLDAVKSHTCKNQSSKANMPVYFTGSTNGLTTARSAGKQGWRQSLPSTGKTLDVLKFTVSRPREPVFWASLLACSARLQPYAPVFLFDVGLCTDGVWWYAH